jgi:cell division septum initiation protein DivIVA
MTKSQELQAWEAFYHSLPAECYSKGAVVSLLIQLECALRSDFIPTLSFADANAAAVGVQMNAERAANCILESATEQANAIVKQATENAERMAARIKTWKANTIRQLEII